MHPGEQVGVRVARIAADTDAAHSLPLVIIPGWGGEIDRFTDLALAVSSHTPACIYEPHGFGESRAPHRSALFTPEAYNREMQWVFGELGFSDRGFTMLGSCSGSAMAFLYTLSGRRPRPAMLFAFSPVLSYRTPSWMRVFDLIPTPLMEGVQQLILRVLRLYLGRKSPEEVRSITYITGQLERSDGWAQRRFITRYVLPYDVSARAVDIDVPVVAFVGESDWFTSPEGSGGLMHHRDSRVHVIPSRGHRIQDGREEEIARLIGAELTRLGC